MAQYYPCTGAGLVRFTLCGSSQVPRLTTVIDPAELSDEELREYDAREHALCPSHDIKARNQGKRTISVRFALEEAEAELKRRLEETGRVPIVALLVDEDERRAAEEAARQRVRAEKQKRQQKLASQRDQTLRAVLHLA